MMKYYSSTNTCRRGDTRSWLATVACLLAGAVAIGSAQASSPQIIEQVLVKVNGDIITKSEL